MAKINNLRRKKKLRKQIAAMLSGCMILGGGLLLPATTFAGPLDNPALFDKTIQFEGNTVIASETLQKVLRSLYVTSKGKISPGLIQDALYNAYKEAGYSLVTIKVPSNINDGDILHIVVNEIKVNHITVTGNKLSNEKDILAAVPALQEGKTPNIARMSSQMLLANDNPYRHITVDIRPLGNGLADAVVSVQETNSIHYAISLDNTGNKFTGQTRVTTAIFDSNINGQGSMGSFNYTTSPDEHVDKVTQLGAFYQIPLPQTGDNLYFTGSYFNTDSGQVVNMPVDSFGDNITGNGSGKGSAFGVHYLHNLQRTVTERQTIDVGLDIRNFDTTNVEFFGPIPVADNGYNISTMPLSLAYQNSSKSARDAVTFGVNYVHNIPAGGRNSTSTYDSYQYLAGTNANYQVWRYNAGYQHQFDKGWLFNTVLAGQYTGEKLIDPERFSLGGVRSVRGLEEGEVSADKGYRLSLEVYTPEIAPAQRLLAFVDGGRYWNVEPGPADTAHHVSSYGIGWRYADQHGFSLNADLAEVIQGTANTPDHHIKLCFSVTKII